MLNYKSKFTRYSQPVKLKMSDYNLILDADFYKISHYKQYPPGTTKLFSYIESRGSDTPRYKSTVFFGLQYIIKKYLMKPIEQKHIDEAKEIIGETFNCKMWEHVIKEHNGYLPIKIRAVKEGSVIPLNNVLITVENTCSRCFWLTTFIETILMRIWYPITVCTESYSIKQLLKKYADISSTADIDTINYMLHDFGSRGVSSCETSEIGAAAHLVNFNGTDTLGAMKMIKNYYNKITGSSIPAMEHSTVTSWTKEREIDAYKNMMKQFNGTISIVGDSYNIYNMCENIIGTELKNEIINSNRTVVIRPDSGNPVEVVIKCLNILADKFGTYTNSKNFKVLKHVKILQGDGINYEMINKICDELILNKYSVENVIFGMGGALLQKHNRDTLKFAMKCSYAVINDKEVDVYKQPITDANKKSKKGKLDLIINSDGNYETVRVNNSQLLDGAISSQLLDGAISSQLLDIFENGKLLYDYNFQEIKETVKKYS